MGIGFVVDTFSGVMLSDFSFVFADFPFKLTTSLLFPDVVEVLTLSLDCIVLFSSTFAIV